MRRFFVTAGGILTALLCSSCSTPWITNTPRSAIEQYLIAITIERGVKCTDFAKYTGQKAFLDYEYLSPQVDKSYLQGQMEMQLSKADVIITREIDEADIIVQPLCGVLATDHSRFFVGTPQLPIPVPDTSLSLAIPEIPVFSKYSRVAYGRFAFNIFDAKTRRPLDTYEAINASAKYNDWIVVLVPFSSHNLDMGDTVPAETIYEFIDL